MIKKIVIECVFAAIKWVAHKLQFRRAQPEELIREIVAKFLELRTKGTHEKGYELNSLQKSGILRLKKEKDANEVLRRIKDTDKPIAIPEFIRDQGVLTGLRRAVDDGVNLDDFRDVTIYNIRHQQQGLSNA